MKIRLARVSALSVPENKTSNLIVSDLDLTLFSISLEFSILLMFISLLHVCNTLILFLSLFFVILSMLTSKNNEYCQVFEHNLSKIALIIFFVTTFFRVMSEIFVFKNLKFSIKINCSRFIKNSKD